MSYRIGKADIRRLELQSNVSKNTTDISHIFAKLSVYEDIFQNHMTSAVDVLDATSLRTTLPLSGGEAIRIDCGERGTSKDIRALTGKFNLFQISDLRRANVDGEMYSFNFVTPEHLADATLSVSGSYHKPISEIVQNIVTTYIQPINKKKLIEVEASDGLHSLVATGITPSAFLRQCAREAQSQDNPSSIYLFYETVEGYHFVTLDYLYKKDAQHTLIYDIVTQSEASGQASGKLQNQITHLIVQNQPNLIEAQMSGQYHTQTLSFDPLSKTRRATTYDYSKDFQQSKYVNKTLNTDVTAAQFPRPTVTRLVMTDSHRRDITYVVDNDPQVQHTFRRRQDFMDRERAVMRQYSSIRLTISIPGNSNIIAGQTVNIVIPNASDTHSEKMTNDRLLSGKYLVSAIAHNINNAGDYASIIELLRPGYEENVV